MFVVFCKNAIDVETVTDIEMLLFLKSKSAHGRGRPCHEVARVSFELIRNERRSDQSAEARKGSDVGEEIDHLVRLLSGRLKDGSEQETGGFAIEKSFAR